MALKRIINLTEGPLDFVRGAVQQLGPAASRVAQSGRAASAEADLVKAITALVKMLQQPTQPPATSTQPAAPRYSTPGAQPAPAQQMPTNPQMTFSSFIQDAYGDRIDEGVWDFVKGAAKETGRKIGAEFRKRYAPPSALSDIVNAGRDASRAGNAQRTANQLPNQVKLIQQILQRLPNAQNSLRRAIGQVAGRGVMANKVYSMIVPSTQPAAPTAATTPPPAIRTSTQWQQGTPAAQPAAAQPRVRQPAANPRRRPRPTAP